MYSDSLRVAQTNAHKGDLNWYVQSANGFAISEGYSERSDAEAKLRALRETERQEIDEEWVA